MAGLSDIFISYAFVDNEPLQEADEGWISNFHQLLEVRLAQLIGEKPKIWRAPKLQGNDHLSDTIVSRLKDVRLLLSVVTPRYIKSEWCTKEVDEFIRFAEDSGGVRLNGKSRIFKVVKTPVPYDEHHPEMTELIGYEFYQTDEMSGRPREFNKVFGPESEQMFWAKLDDLAHDISKTLHEVDFEFEDSVKKEAREMGTDVEISIYLAESSYDLKAERDKIKRELLEFGYDLMPDQSLPLVVDEFESTVNGFLDKCKIAIHLVGESYGIIPDGASNSIVEIQNDLAAKKSKENGLVRFIWKNPEANTEDERQKAFVKKLETDADAQFGADLLETPLENLKFAIHDKINELMEAEKAKKVAAAAAAAAPESGDTKGDGKSGPKSIYLICDQNDMDEIMDLEDMLFDEGYNVILPVFEGDETQVRLDHQENLKTCDAALLFYGAANDLWMRAMTRDLDKIAGYGRNAEFLATGVVIAGPTTPRKERFRSHDLIVMKCIEAFSKESLVPFMDKMKNGA